MQLVGLSYITVSQCTVQKTKDLITVCIKERVSYIESLRMCDGILCVSEITVGITYNCN